jgi:4-nitrophenyl phosphatase
MTDLNDIRTLIIDMDGVLWEGNTALPGLQPFFELIRNQQLKFILATNNASLTQQQYIEKLSRLGIAASTSEVLTSSMATAHYLSQISPSHKTRVFVIGEPGLKVPLQDQGFILVEGNPKDCGGVADYVISGLDRELNWHKLAQASLHLNQGAQFIATNADTTLPTEQGPVLGNGAIIAALTAATGIKPIVIGKPEAHMYQFAMKILSAEPHSTVAIGDRLNTDILGAVNAGIRSILLLSGISSRQDLVHLNYQPDWIFNGLPDLTEALASLFKTNT